MGRNVSTRKIARAAYALGITNPRELPLHKCIAARAKAYSEYRKYASNVKLIHRPNFLDTLIDTKTADGDRHALTLGKGEPPHVVYIML